MTYRANNPWRHALILAGAYFIVMLIPFSITAQKVDLEVKASLSKVMAETSGLAYIDGRLWTHNDSGGDPILYEIAKNGQVSSAVYLSATTNVDWEDLTQDDDGNIYIGDFGNGENDRRTQKVQKIPNPSLLEAKVATPGSIYFQFEDQQSFPPHPSQWNYDMEAMIWHEGFLYLFTKNRTTPFTGFTRMYSIPDKPGEHTAELIDSVYLGPEPMISSWVTAADISPDKQRLILLSHDKMWVFSCFEGADFFSGEMTEIQFSSNSQKEAICFKDNGSVYITDERIGGYLGGKLYSLDINRLALPNCKQ